MDAPPVVPPPIPWTADTLRPLFKQLIPICERADVDALKREAEKISPLAVKLVGEKAGWSEPVKALLEQSAGECAAKWMNKLGVSAEYAPEVTLGTALCSLWATRSALLTELRALAEEVKKEREKTPAPAAERKAA